jgi:hypothetical protein
MEVFEGIEEDKNPFLISLENNLTCDLCSNLMIKREKALDISLTPDINKVII